MREKLCKGDLLLKDNFLEGIYLWLVVLIQRSALEPELFLKFPVLWNADIYIKF